MNNLFTDYQDLAEEKVVIIGKGTRHRVVGIGRIKLEAFDGYLWVVTTLENVLFVLSMVINLFSVRYATDKVFIMLTDEEMNGFKD